MNARNQAGAGLIEVLVAVLILGVGLLGLAGLQTQSLRFNNEAYFRTQATLFAMDMADRMRANFETVRTNPNAYKFDKNDGIPSGVTDCESAACSPSDLALYDFKVWKERVLDVLPGGSVSVTPDSGTATQWQDYTIQIEYGSTESSTAQSFKYRVRI